MHFHTRFGSHFRLDLPSKIILGFGIGLLILLLTAVASGAADETGARASGIDGDDAKVEEPDTADDAAGETETITLTIPLEKGGEIDVEANHDVVIETWDGDDVLLIVEKRLIPHTMQHGKRPTTPVKIDVIRDGKNVRIRERGASQWHMNGLDVRFRIMVPRTDVRVLRNSPAIGSTSAYDLSKLTTVLVKALHREAIRWIVR